jgi:hypothetical protein
VVDSDEQSDQASADEKGVTPKDSADEQSDQAPASAHSHDIADMSRECAAQAAIDLDDESESEESEVSGDEGGATVEQAVSGGAQPVSGSSHWARMASVYPQGLRVGASVFPCSPRRQLWSHAALMFHPDVLATRVSRPGLRWSECRATRAGVPGLCWTGRD